MNIQNWLECAKKKLKKISLSPNLDAEILLSYVLNKSRTWIIGYNFSVLTNYHMDKLNYLLGRRISGEPIAYLIKKKEFWSYSFLVTHNTLIPRLDTEILVENALFYLESFKNAKILDLGTGCGCIAISLAIERPDCKITGIDYNFQSINVAKKNAKRFKVKNVRFLYSFWFSKINCVFDMIVCNPPYIGFHEIKDLRKEVLFEPLSALVSSKCGLESIIYIIKFSKKYLCSRGWLLVEHGWKQKNSVQKLFYKYNFINIITYQDYCGNDRITVGQTY
ncbi:MAG: peptide chain release factor N(5)-glutamine methyltransferase [Buchnera aphidicola (Chaetogeoica yunlongensis)]